MKKHILFTANDIGAAHQIKHIARAFAEHGFMISVVASGVAYETLLADGLNPQKFAVNKNDSSVGVDSSENLIEELIQSSYEVIEKIKPDAVFCGLTTSGYGIDEAILYWSSHVRLNIPSFQFLDTWGTFNHFKDGYPCLYFAIDEATKNLANMGAKAPIEVVGSPKHFAYSSLPISNYRERTRKKMNVNINEKLIVYFGQDPKAPGQTYNFIKLVEAISVYSLNGGECKFLMRMHPAYADRYENFSDYLRKTDITIVDHPAECSVEEILCACDLAVTCFSTAAIDHAFLSSFADKPIGAAMYLLCGNEIKEYMFKNFGYWRPPLLVGGIGYHAEDDEQLLSQAKNILDNPSAVNYYHESTRSLIADNPLEKIVGTVSSYIQ